MSNSIRPKAVASAASTAQGPDIEEDAAEFDLPDTSEASGAPTATVVAPVDETAEDAATTVAANKLVEKTGKVTSDRETQEKLIGDFERRSGKRQPRRKRQLIKRALGKAGYKLRKKTKIRLVKTGRPIRVRTKTGRIVTGSLAKGERSKVLTASDGSRVVLIDRRAEKSEISAVIKSLVSETIKDAGTDFSIDLGGTFLAGLQEWFESDFGEFLATAYAIPTIAYAISDLVADSRQDQQLLDEDMLQRLI